MNPDFHYYGTYCAALIAGFNKKESERIAYSAAFVDFCSRTVLRKCGAPLSATTTQTNLELADFSTDILGLQEITRIWSSFHFLPGDLYAPLKYGSKRYKWKYRLICKTNSSLLLDTVNLAKGESLEAIGIVMHILADTWAHQYFAGTPSFVINNISGPIYEIQDGKEYPITFTRNPSKFGNIEERKYSHTIYEPIENTIMNLGHGRLGHLPDLSFIKYKYMPAWGKWNVVIKDNPGDFYNAFAQMVEALKCYKENREFKLHTYDPLNEYSDKVKHILSLRQLTNENEWKEFAEELSNSELKPFELDLYEFEYIKAEDKKGTLFDNFISHALKQKSMVTNRISKSKNRLAGFSVEFNGTTFKGLKDYWKLLEHELRANKDEQN